MIVPVTFFVSLQRGQWRIIKVDNHYEHDLCGAASHEVAAETVRLLNAMRGGAQRI